MESLEILANNTANAATAGYKADREFYNLYVEGGASDANREQGLVSPNMPLIQANWTDFSQGTLTPTGNPLDLAISGKGFFAVTGSNGTLYTRNGGFRLSPEGVLQTADGHAVQAEGGGQIKLNPSARIEVGPDGTVRQNGQTVAKLQIAEFSQTSALEKRGGNYFSLADVAALRAGFSGSVYQGRLESANSAPAESAVRLVNVLRQFEMLQKAVTLGGEMNRRSVEEVAKVNA